MLLLNNDFYTSRPSRLSNPNFGMVLNLADFMPHVMDVQMFPMGRKYYTMQRQNAVSTKDSDLAVTKNEKNFQIKLDVKQFKPNEVTVKVVGKNTITIEGKHEEREDDQGTVYRHFLRKCLLPEGYDINGVVSNLSSDGVLSISAPPIGKVEESVRTLEIQRTEEPSSKSIENDNGMEDVEQK